MVKLSLQKNIKRICVTLCLVTVLFPVCRIQAEELETQQATVETTVETEAKWDTSHIITDYFLFKPDEISPLYPENHIYEKRGLAVFEDWLDVETFVSPEKLFDRFGDFERFYFYSEEVESLYGDIIYEETIHYTDAYVYLFETEQGGKYNISIHIEKLQSDGVVRHLQEVTESIRKRNVDPEDLRKADKPGTYWVGNIGYTYEYNEQYDEQYSTLSSFRWQSGGYVFLVDIDETAIEQYTLEDGGFIAKMLREETAPGAVEQFSKELPAYNLEVPVQLRSDGENGNWIGWIVLSGIAFFVVTVTVLVLLRRKRKRKTPEVVTDSGEMSKEE